MFLSHFLHLGRRQTHEDFYFDYLRAFAYISSTDYNAVEAVVDATHRYKEIFYESADT